VVERHTVTQGWPLGTKNAEFQSNKATVEVMAPKIVALLFGGTLRLRLGLRW